MVKPAVDIFKTLSDETFETYKYREKNHKLNETWRNNSGNIKAWVTRLYREKEAIRILLSKSDGTMYSNFIHDFIEENFKGSYKLMKDWEQKDMCTIDLTYEEYHILVTCYWTALFEMFIHDFTLEHALVFALKIDRLFAWREFIKF